MKPFWEITEGEAQKCLDATKWTPGNLGYFRGGGFSSTFKTRGGMPVTMCRMNLVKGLGPVLQIAEGYTVELPDDMNKILWDRTDPGWPCTWFAPVLTGEGAFTDVYLSLIHISRRLRSLWQTISASSFLRARILSACAMK